MSVADSLREAVCGRVVAMLSAKGDAPDEVVRRLTSALHVEPIIVPRSTLRFDACLVMLVVGALVAMVGMHVLRRSHERRASERNEEASDEEEIAVGAREEEEDRKRYM